MNYELFFPCTFPFLFLYYFYAEFQNRISTVSIISPKAQNLYAVEKLKKEHHHVIVHLLTSSCIR